MKFFNKKNIIIITIIIIAITVIIYFCFLRKRQLHIKTSTNPLIDKVFNNDSVDTSNIIPVDNYSNVYLEIKIGKENKGRIIIQLFDNDVPKTAKNFRHLCIQGIKGGLLNKPYINTKFHRVIKKFMVQGGDIENNNGMGGYSIYGKYFDDENFVAKHNQQGLVAMANNGKNKNNSQFYILTAKKGAPWLDGKYVIFGIILSGYNIVKDIEKIATNNADVPLIDCEIIDTGIINEDKKADECLKFSI